MASIGQSRQHLGSLGWPRPTPFFAQKKKQGKKERVLKQKLLKGCHQGQNVTILAIPEFLEFKSFSCQLKTVADNTI